MLIWIFALLFVQIVAKFGRDVILVCVKLLGASLIVLMYHVWMGVDVRSYIFPNPDS